MKKITFFLFALSCFVNTQSFSQICPPVNSDNTATLDWENEQTFTFYLTSNGGDSSSKRSPFFAIQTSCNDNITTFCNPPLQNKDISSADGWRYVNHDFGRADDPIECPVFVLYNIHSGILRVFFYQSLTVVDGNAAVISLEHAFGSKTTALLEHYKGAVKNAVQVFDNARDKKVIVPNTYLRSPSWQHADFVTQYDPCTCQSASLYRFKLVSTEKSKISFTLNGQIIQEIKPNQLNGATAGVTVKQPDAGLTAIAGLLGVNASAAQPYIAILNSVSVFYPKLGKIIKVTDFFSGLLKEETAAPKATPLVFNANLSGAGQIETDNPLQQQPLNAPGSDLSNVDTINRPVYNRVLGTFSLLTSPEVNVNTYVNRNYNSFYDADYDMWCDEESGYGYSQIELTSPIKWLLNPSANLSVDKLNAAYIVYFQKGQKIETANYPLECFQYYKPTFELDNYYFGCYSWANQTMNPITRIDLKIVGNFTAGNNQKLVFSSLYNISKTETEVESQPTDAFPYSNCSAISPSASESEIHAVCASSQYTSRRDQFFVAPTDNGNKMGRKGKNSLKNSSELQISPNPANSSMEIQYSLKTDSYVKIAIYDLAGKMVKSLANDNDVKQGQYILQVDLSDIASGMYIVQLNVNGKMEIKKLSVIKR